MKINKVFWLGIFFFAIYIACRTWIVLWLPVLDQETFFRRDLSLTCAWILLFISILFLARKKWSFLELGFNKGQLLLPVTVGFLMLASAVLRLSPPVLDRTSTLFFICHLGAILFNSVGEEISFRGFIYNCLREIRSRDWAEYAGSFLFMLMHISFQPFSSLPAIFVQGLILSKLRTKGVSLTALILIHGLNNFLFFAFESTGSDFHSPYSIIGLILLLVALGTVNFWKRSEGQELLRG